MHEFADVGRPITAAFAGAPGNSFTVFGATPLRNAAVVGLQATTTIAAATQIYLRYDGEIATGTDNHALNIGVRMSWVDRLSLRIRTNLTLRSARSARLEGSATA